MKQAPETIEEFQTLWAAECAEWQALRDELLAAGEEPSAHDVTEVQRGMMRARGELPVMDSIFARRLVTRAVDRGVRFTR